MCINTESDIRNFLDCLKSLKPEKPIFVNTGFYHVPLKEAVSYVLTTDDSIFLIGEFLLTSHARTINQSFRLAFRGQIKSLIYILERCKNQKHKNICVLGSQSSREFFNIELIVEEKDHYHLMACD
jgi:hypothetical protein